MDRQALLEALCEIIEAQSGIIKDLATRLNERDDVDLAERIAESEERCRAVLGAEPEGRTSAKSITEDLS